MIAPTMPISNGISRNITSSDRVPLRNQITTKKPSTANQIVRNTRLKKNVRRDEIRGITAVHAPTSFPGRR